MILTIENGVTEAEKNQVITEEEVIAKKLKKEIATLSITVEGEELVSKVEYKSKITRIRRITGYCSKIENFNASKLAELNDRNAHIRL